MITCDVTLRGAVCSSHLTVYTLYSTDRCDRWLRAWLRETVGGEKCRALDARETWQGLAKPSPTQGRRWDAASRLPLPHSLVFISLGRFVPSGVAPAARTSRSSTV